MTLSFMSGCFFLSVLCWNPLWADVSISALTTVRSLPWNPNDFLLQSSCSSLEWREWINMTTAHCCGKYSVVQYSGIHFREGEVGLRAVSAFKMLCEVPQSPLKWTRVPAACGIVSVGYWCERDDTVFEHWDDIRDLSSTADTQRWANESPLNGANEAFKSRHTLNMWEPFFWLLKL